MKVSIIIPVFNEESSITKVLEAVQSVILPLEKEIIVIDDGSTDGTHNKVATLHSTIVLTHKHNKGKGAALRSGNARASGDIILFQDADMEYNPNDYDDLLRPLIDGTADVVYGSRFIGKKQEHFFIHTYLANKFLSFLTRLFIRLPVTDMETCYKAFRSDILKSLPLVENRFGIEPEITMKLARIKNIRYKEVPISYTGRSIKQGKKVRWYDGVRAIWCIIKYGFFSSNK